MYQTCIKTDFLPWKLKVVLQNAHADGNGYIFPSKMFFNNNNFYTIFK